MHHAPKATCTCLGLCSARARARSHTHTHTHTHTTHATPGTAHGCFLENLIKNPTLSDLVGGIQPVTLGDEEAARRGCKKSILERGAPPTVGPPGVWRVGRVRV